MGVYPEIKDPAWHRDQGQDIAPTLLATLRNHGFAENQVFVQCFDGNELERVRTQLACEFPLVQLLEREPGIPARRELAAMAEYANAIGPPISLLFDVRGDELRPTALTRAAHELGLLIHAYTVRVDALPAGAASLDQLMRVLCRTQSLDGVFTDFPDQVGRFLDANG